MRNQFTLLLAVIISGFTSCTFAEGGGKDFEGKIIYTIANEIPVEYQDQESMLPTEMTTFITKDFTRVEQSTGLGEQVTINLLESGKTILLVNLMGKKIAILSTDEEDVKDVEPEIKILKETKTIAGYKCKKAIYKIKGSDNKMVSFEVFYTKKIPTSANTQFPGLAGFPLEYVIESQGIVMTYTAKEIIKEEVSAKLGEIPTAYEQMNYQEFMQLIGG